VRASPAALLVAVGLDVALGEPRSCWHPVAWIGRALEGAEACARRRDVTTGAAAVLLVTAGVAAAAALAGALARRLGPVGTVVEALALKPAFAVRRLATAAREVEAALRARRLDEARRLAGRHLVSRATAGLGEAEVISAVVESVAENLTDSVVAPLLAYSVGGLPAAWAYRTLNTADAMWGYRDARYETFGKAAARLDDVANLVPARLAAAAVAAGAALAGADAREAVRGVWREHRRTASPNAGWPMAAMAGALAIGLAKRDAYRLGERPLPESPAVIERALAVFAGATAVAIAGALGLALWRARRARGERSGG
jgi:adenosylcobinamide-phosphate synthase